MFLVSSCSCLCPIHWNHVLSREWRCLSAMLPLHLGDQRLYSLLRPALYQRFDGKQKLIKYVWYHWTEKNIRDMSSYMYVCFKNQRTVKLEYPLQLSKQWRRWGFETPSRSLWRHRNAIGRPSAKGHTCHIFEFRANNMASSHLCFKI